MHNDSKKALKNKKGIFTVGSNTFLLVKTLYDADLIQVLAHIVKKTPFISAQVRVSACRKIVSSKLE